MLKSGSNSTVLRTGPGPERGLHESLMKEEKRQGGKEGGRKEGRGGESQHLLGHHMCVRLELLSFFWVIHFSAVSFTPCLVSDLPSLTYILMLTSEILIFFLP